MMQVEADHVTVTSKSLSSYHVTKKPTFSSVPLCHLEQVYGASQLHPALKLFLQENLPGHTLEPNKYNHYSVHNAIHITSPSKPYISNHKCHKTIHTTPEHMNGP